MKQREWPRQKKPSLSWQHLSAREPESGERWTVIWDTKRKAGAGGRNTAVEKHELAALDRARHLLRMGFVVYQIRDPSGAVFLETAAIRSRLGLKPEAREEARKPFAADERDAGVGGLS